ncbi:MAG: Hpt domain-containing protein [Candidatus Binatia bacterium]|nr:Hpt domain-containing protein [Candidatus Binatia bacterium]
MLSDNRNSPIFSAFNKRRALAAAGGDLNVLREIVGLFLVDLPRRLRELRSALKAGELERVAAVAHSLRGSAAVFGCDEAVDATIQLELLAKQGASEHLADTAKAVEQIFHSLAEEAAAQFFDRADLAATTETGPVAASHTASVKL